MSIFNLVVSGFGLVRFAIGLAPFVAPEATSRMLGFPRSHDTATARLMARFFGVRDIGLGVLAFYAVKHPEAASFLFLFNAFMDLGDLLSATVPIIKRQGIDRAAALSALMAIGGALGWLVLWLIA